MFLYLIGKKKDSKELKEDREEYNWKAILNYLREEIRIAAGIPENVITIIEGINEKPDMKEITKMKDDLKIMVINKKNLKQQYLQYNNVD